MNSTSDKKGEKKRNLNVKNLDLGGGSSKKGAGGERDTRDEEALMRG